ncbi:MAG: hypothetical protein ABI321_05165 [Polyangia bacterium]
MDSLALAVLVYASGGAPRGEPSATGPRARVVAALRPRAKVIDHAIDAALAARRQGWRTLEELGFLSRGRAALDRGRRAREAVELDEAEQQLALAEASYAEGLGEPGVATLAAGAALEHGVALGELGRTEEARQAFARALDWSARIELTERFARPDVVRLFREVANARGAPAVASAPVDHAVERIEVLREAPSQVAAESLRAALGLDGVVLVASSSDGRRLVGARVASGCATQVFLLTDDASVSALLDAPCEAHELALRVDDPRLAAPPALALVAPRAEYKHPSRKVWPIVVGATLGVAALTVIGVTIGFVLSDPSYRVHVNPGGF